MTWRLVGALLAVAILLFALTRVAVHYAFLAIAAYRYPLIDPVVETFQIPADTATQRRLQVEEVVGSLDITPGTTDVLSGTAFYNVAEFAPTVQYDHDETTSQVVLRHTQELETLRMINSGERINDWDLALATQVPYTSLDIALGVGEATLDLSGVIADHAHLAVGTGNLALTTPDAPFEIDELLITIGTGEATLDLRQSRFMSATVEVGVGDMLVDLRADWQHDTHALFETGIGSITLILPEEVGVRVRVTGGFGAVETTKLTRLDVPELDVPELDVSELDVSEEADGVVYVNTAYASSPITIDLIAERGIGEVFLLTEAPEPEVGDPEVGDPE